MHLKEIGYNQYIEAQYNSINCKEQKLARISAEHKNLYKIITEDGEFLAEIAGKMYHRTNNNSHFPAVGDWVIIKEMSGTEKVLIEKLIPRKTKVSRNVAGKRTEEQIIAANMDYIFIVNGLDNDFNLNRIERYLTIAWDSGAKPVIILNKSDLCNNEEIKKKKTEVENNAYGVPVHVISCKNKTGIKELEKYFKQGKTTALLGSSGVGKSSLINIFLGEERQETNETRESDGKGRHTTTSRELIILPDGGIIIDTPGMREIQLWGRNDGITGVFSDIEEIAQKCKFNDCAHTHEPHCAVKRAVEEGKLAKKRLENYHKMKRELLYLKRKEMMSADKIEYNKWYEITKKSRKTRS